MTDRSIFLLRSVIVLRTLPFGGVRSVRMHWLCAISCVEEIVYHLLHMDGGDIVALEHGDKVPQLFPAERDVGKACCFIESVFRVGNLYAIGNTAARGG